MKRIETKINKKIRKVYHGISEPHSTYIIDFNAYRVRLGCHVSFVTGTYRLNYGITISINEIESKITPYSKLLYSFPQENDFYQTIAIGPRLEYNQKYLHRINGIDLTAVLKDMPEDKFVNDLIENYTVKVIEKYSKLEELDKVLNTSDDPSIFLQYSGSPAVAFHKIFLAQAVQNPRLLEIIDNMRDWTDISYSMQGATEFDKNKKFVFEELFGKRQS